VDAEPSLEPYNQLVLCIRLNKGASLLATTVYHGEYTPTIRSGALCGLERVLSARGVRLSALCERLDMDPSALRDSESRMPVQRFIELLELAATQVNDDALGLHLCSNQPLSILGTIAEIYLQAPDYFTAIESGIKSMSLHQEGASLELTIDGDYAICAYVVRSPHLIACRQDTELSVARMLRFGRAIARRPDFVPTAVYFEHPSPRHVSEHRRVFGAPVYFAQHCSGLVFRKELLYQPMRNGVAPMRRRMAAPPARREVAPNLSSELRRHLMRSIRHGRASIKDSASALGCQVRTLQRRLAAERMTFDELLETTRYELALHYLKQDHLSVTEIGSLLGYAELSTFSRAFRRWSGASPLAFRTGIAARTGGR
jgi:AraC-like DNA-binding protein